MADEVSTVMVLRMRDEASTQMRNFGDSMGGAETEAVGLQAGLSTVDAEMVSLTSTTQQATVQTLNLQMTLTSMGTALVSIGSLLNQMDAPAAKTAANFFLISGALLSTVSAIIAVRPMITSLITSLRALAITQAIVKALSGPVGWAQLGVGLAIAGAATAGIVAMTGGFGGGQTNIKIEGGPLLMTDDAAMTRFGRKVEEATRTDGAKGR